eukprot:Gb_13566 [translate_table: standard]
MDTNAGTPRAQLFSDKYLYVCDKDQEGLHIINSHHIIVKRKWMQDFLVWCLMLLLLTFICTSLSPTARGTNFVGMLLLCIISTAIIRRNGIEQESVVVMPKLGVQLETSYKSGKILRRFVPIGNILAAVINEGVTPFTCYWYLALVVREEKKLSLVFQELRPPLNMLVPIWKSLCTAVTNKTLQQSK